MMNFKIHRFYILNANISQYIHISHSLSFIGQNCKITDGNIQISANNDR